MLSIAIHCDDKETLFGVKQGASDTAGEDEGDTCVMTFFVALQVSYLVVGNKSSKSFAEKIKKRGPKVRHPSTSTPRTTTHQPFPPPSFNQHKTSTSTSRTTTYQRFPPPSSHQRIKNNNTSDFRRHRSTSASRTTTHQRFPPPSFNQNIKNNSTEIPAAILQPPHRSMWGPSC